MYVKHISDFIWPFLRPYMGVIPNPKMAFIFPISCILALIFPILIIYFPKCVGKGSFPKSQIKSLHMKKSKWLDCQGNEFFPKTKGDSITGQDRAQKHCDFRFSQIEKKSKVAVLQLESWLTQNIFSLELLHWWQR